MVSITFIACGKTTEIHTETSAQVFSTEKPTQPAPTEKLTQATESEKTVDYILSDGTLTIKGQGNIPSYAYFENKNIKTINE